MFGEGGMAALRPTLEAIDRLYGAVMTPETWSSALESVADLLEAGHAIVFDTGSADGGPDFGIARMDPEGAARICSPDAARLGGAILRATPLGLAISSATVIADRDMEGSTLYNEILRPVNGFYSNAALLRAPGGAVTSINFCRPRRAGAFDIAEVGTLQSILPHFANVLELRRRLGTARQQSDHLLQLLEHVDSAIILIDATTRPCFANGRALRIMAQADGLALGAAGLLAATPTATQRLRRAIAAVGSPAGDGGNGTVVARPSARLRLERPSLRPPLLVFLFPIWRLGAPTPGTPASRIAIFITEPDDCPPIDGDAIADTFRLTPREAAVASLLASGHDLKSAARLLTIGIGTARYHLKHVFEKTGTSGQVGLLALLRGFAGPRR